MWENIKKEPVLLSTLAGALLSVAAAFGLNLSAEQTGAVVGLVTVISAVVFGRSNVTPNSDVVVYDKGDGPLAGEKAPAVTGSELQVINLDPELLGDGTLATEPQPGYWGGNLVNLAGK